MAGTCSPLTGKGDILSKEVFRLCESVGAVQWFIVEQEACACSPLVTVEKRPRNLWPAGCSEIDAEADEDERQHDPRRRARPERHRRPQEKGQ